MVVHDCCGAVKSVAVGDVLDFTVCESEECSRGQLPAAERLPHGLRVRKRTRDFQRSSSHVSVTELYRTREIWLSLQVCKKTTAAN